MRPSLVLLAGPNGSGKSTLYETRVAESFRGPFINADLIQRDELRDRSVHAAYEAASIAAERREALLEARESFATETVFSHPSKLDVIRTARERGYLVLVMHVSVESPELSVARVAERTKEGGHAVPEQKIRERYARSVPLIREAVLAADVGLVFDNTPRGSIPQKMLEFKRERLVRAEPFLPQWILQAYAKDLI